jgi:hypothetical protein
VGRLTLTRKSAMSEKERLIEDILELELNMFINVRSRYPASCQENPDGFRFHRRTQFSVWSEETLQSYLDDLLEAKEQGHNVMTLKYARMENLIPPLSVNPMIDLIVEMQLEAQRKMFSCYPNLLKQGRPLEDDSLGPISFKTYLRGELETYSDRTLGLLYRDMQQIKDRGENWAELLYTNLARNLGYNSLSELEEALRKKNAER